MRQITKKEEVVYLLNQSQQWLNEALLTIDMWLEGFHPAYYPENMRIVLTVAKDCGETLFNIAAVDISEYEYASMWYDEDGLTLGFTDSIVEGWNYCDADERHFLLSEFASEWEERIKSFIE